MQKHTKSLSCPKCEGTSFQKSIGEIANWEDNGLRMVVSNKCSKCGHSFLVIDFYSLSREIMAVVDAEPMAIEKKDEK